MQVLANSACYWPKFADQCVLVTDDAPRPHSTMEDLCIKARDNVVTTHSMLANRCVKVADNTKSPHSTLADRFGQAKSVVESYID